MQKINFTTHFQNVYIVVPFLYRYGRITIYLYSAFGAGLCGIIVAFAPNIVVFSIFRFFQGIFGKGTWMSAFVIGKIFAFSVILHVGDGVLGRSKLHWTELYQP